MQLADEHGTVTQEYAYDAFGVEQDPDAADTNPLRYCGEYYDAQTGTYYLRARNYTPTLGRFTSEDPAQDGLNWYTYCVGNPVMFIDPSGCVIVLEGSEEEKNIILENLQMLTDHDLAYDLETGVLYIETLRSGELQYTHGNTLLTRLMNNDDYTTTIMIGDRNQTKSEKSIDDYGIKSNSTVFFDPDLTVKLAVMNPQLGELVLQECPAYIALAHELIHADRLMRGIALPIWKKEYFYMYRFYTTKSGKSKQEFIGCREIYADEFFVIGIHYMSRSNYTTENQIRAEHNLWLRGEYELKRNIL